MQNVKCKMGDTGCRGKLLPYKVMVEIKWELC